MKKIMTLVVSAALAFFASASLLAATKYYASIEIDDSGVPEGCKVAVSGTKQISQDKTETNYTGKVTLKATAAKGYVFAGWGVAEGILNEDSRSATATFTIEENMAFEPSFAPRFVKIGDDYLNGDETPGLGFLDPEDNLFAYALQGLEVGAEVNILLYVPSASFPTVSFKGLPAGVKFDAKKLCFSGKPTKAGIYQVSMSVKNASGYTAEQFGIVTVDYPAGNNVSFAEDEQLAKFNAEDPYGADVDYPVVGEEIDIAPFIVDCSGSGFKSIKVSGLPAGLKYDVVGNTLSGKLTKAGDYAIVATVKFVDVTLPDETISMLVRVLPEEFRGEPLIDSGVLMVGMEGGTYWGKYSKGTKIVAKGLPAGLKVVKDTDDSEWDYFFIEGTPTKAGDYLVTFTVTEGSDKYEYSLVFNVQPAPSFYLDVQSTDEDAGTVTGAGIYNPSSKFTIKATPKSGYSFSFWDVQLEGATITNVNVASQTTPAMWLVDYRNLDSGELLPVSEWLFPSIYANFIAKTADYCELDLYTSSDPAVWELSRDIWWVGAISGSKATVTAKGLPAGIKLYDDEWMYFDDDGRIWQDWYLEADWTKMKPGTYDVQLTAKNLSGKAGQTLTLTIKVPGDQSFDWVNDYPLEKTDFDLDAGVKYEATDFTRVCYLGSNVKMTAKGLPAGLKFTLKDGFYYFTGTPTKGGIFEVTLTAKWYNFTAETTVKVTVNMPEVSVQNWCETEGKATGDICGKVTGSGIDENGNVFMQAGKKVSLKATASSDHVFAGWRLWDYDLGDYVDVDFDFAGVDFRSPSISFEMVTGGYNLEACFVEKADDDEVTISLEGEEFGQDITLNADKTNLTIAAGAPYVLDVLADSYSLPTFKVKGLPAGLKFDAKTATITGVPTKAGTFTVTVDATNVSKAKDQFVFAVTVLPVADWAVGTFNGVISLGEGTNGIFTATVKNTGAISGKVTIDGKSASFSAKNFGSAEVTNKVHKTNSFSSDPVIYNERVVSQTFTFIGLRAKDYVDCDPYVESYGVEVTVKIDGEGIKLPLKFAEFNRTKNWGDAKAALAEFEGYYGMVSNPFPFADVKAASNLGDAAANVPAGALNWAEGAQIGYCYFDNGNQFVQSTKCAFDAKTGYDLDSVIKSSHDLAQIKAQLAEDGAEFVSLTKAGVLKVKIDGKSYTSNIAVIDVVVKGKDNYTEFVAPISTKDEGVIPLYFFVGEHDPS